MNVSALVLLPVLVPLVGALVALLVRRAHRVQAWWSLGVLVTASLSSVALLTQVWTNGPVVVQLGMWPAPFGITLVGDLLSAFMVVMCQSVLVLGAVYALGARDVCVQYPTFYPLFLMLTTGLTGGMLTGDMFNLFVFAELLVISGAALTAMADDRLGVEAALRYFYISLIAGIFLLLACGAFYVSYGTLNMADLAQRLAADPNQPLTGFALVMLSAFFMVKCAAMPFHFWQPDFHTAAPTAVSAMLSSVVVKLGVYGFLRLTTLLYPYPGSALHTVLIVAGLAGIVVGGLAAMRTHNAKRVLAYSTLGQIGYMLIGIGWGTPLGLLTALVAAFNHSLIKSAMLMLAGAVASRASIKSANFEVIGGLGKYMPLTGALFFVGGLGLAGIPPTNGFISKMVLFKGAAQGGDWVVLALVGVSGIISLLYAMRAFTRIWWEPAPAEAKAKPSGDRLLAPAVLIVACVGLGVWAEPLLALAQATVAWLGQPELYIRAVLGG